MIISDDHRFVFVHVPKCAGTSFRRALRTIDTSDGEFWRIGEHPEMGKVHFAHLTLSDLTQYFPVTFARVCDYQSMAIVRDPRDRFFSAIFQRLREFRGQGQSAITPAMVEAEAEAIQRYLESGPERLDLEHVHFNRQCDFIELDGRRIVRQVFTLDRMEDAASYVARITGVKIGGERRNRTTEMRFRALKPLQRMLRTPYSLLVSAKLRTDIREKMTRAGFYEDVSKQEYIQPGNMIDGFILDYYARDFLLYEECRSESVHASV